MALAAEASEGAAADLARVKEWFASGELLPPEGATSVDLARAMALLCDMSPEEVKDHCGAEDLTTACELAEEIGPGEHIVLLVLDGFGINALETHLPPHSFLRRHLRRELRATFPATTAAGLTSLVTGQDPGQHGLLGWTVVVGGHLINPLPLMDEATRAPIVDVGVKAEDVFCGVRPLFGCLPRPCKRVLSPYADTPYACAVTDIPHRQCNTPQEALEQLATFWRQARHARQNSFAYIYCPEPDTTEHAVGVGHEEVGAVLSRLDSELTRFWENEKAIRGRKLVVTADHGHRVVSMQRGEQLLLDPKASPEEATLLRCLRHSPSVEPRSPCFHVKEGMADEFAAAFRKSRFGPTFALLEARQVEELKLLGPAPLSDTARQRLGDFMALTRGPEVIVHRYSSMVGWHGGMTPAEMRIPLIVVDDSDGNSAYAATNGSRSRARSGSRNGAAAAAANGGGGGGATGDGIGGGGGAGDGGGGAAANGGP